MHIVNLQPPTAARRYVVIWYQMWGWMLLAVTCSFRDRAVLTRDTSLIKTLTPDQIRGTDELPLSRSVHLFLVDHRSVLSAAAATVQTASLEHLHCVLEFLAK